MCPHPGPLASVKEESKTVVPATLTRPPDVGPPGRFVPTRAFRGTLDQFDYTEELQWLTAGVAPPRAERIEVGPNELFAKDECGNSRGGVRCVQMDVPRLRYYSNPGEQEDGTPAFGVVGVEEPLAAETLRHLYRDHADYVDRFNRRLDELVEEGWFLAQDAEGMRAEAKSGEVP